MSDGRSNDPTAADRAEVDPEVRALYREIAGETAPGRLDRAVLAEARAAARPRVGRVTAMLKPVAWAATIGLSLAIVLELTVFNELPDGLPASDGIAAPEAASEPPAGPAAPARSRNAPQAGAPHDAERMDEAMPAPSDRDTSPISMESVGDSGTMMLKQAEERARQQLKSSDAAAFRDEARAEGAANGAPRGCDATVTGDPEAWRACIEDLERRGEQALADAERRRFKQAWPDYELP